MYFFCIFMYALFTSSFVKFLDGLRLSILYASWVDIVLRLVAFWLLNENLPEFLNVWINLYNEINWKKDKPLSFNRAKLASVKGNVKRNLPPIANKTANKAKRINKIILMPVDIFLDAILVKTLSKKYKPIKINTVKIIIFIYFVKNENTISKKKTRIKNLS